MLDGKEINEMSRQFLMNWQASKEARRQERQQRQRDAESLRMPLMHSEEIGETFQLPPGTLSHQVLVASSNPSEFKAMISTSRDTGGSVKKKEVVRLVIVHMLCCK